MISLKNIELNFHGEALFSEVNLDIFNEQRIGLIGSNGSGKSSLMSIINQDVAPDLGELNTAKYLRVAIMRQAMPDSTETALNFVLRGHHEYVQLQQQLNQAYEEADNDRIVSCLAQLDDLDAYNLEATAATILHGLGFAKHEIHKSVNTFSGGWRMRLQLAQALLKPSDVMLLDEPTNHLDIAAIAWLEQFILKYQGAVVVISHDRAFLDSIVNHIWHIEHKQIKAYKGNYSNFERLRAEFIKSQQALSEKQQRAITHMQQFVDRFRAKATKAKQVQSRIKALSKLETIQVIQDKSPFRFEFTSKSAISNPALRLQQLQVGYEQPVVSINELTINSGERIGLLGVNGAGKSTLLKTIASIHQPLSGDITRSPKLDLGYYAQDQIEQLRFDESPIWHLLKQHPTWTEQKARDFLGGFNFSGDKALSPVGHFSGGEQSRVMLAVLASKQSNMLLLDEPTNHLDIEMRNALVLSLQEFDGSFLIVSHDRYLLESCCDEFLLVDNGRVESFKGDMSDYQQWLSEKAKAEALTEEQPKKTANNPQSIAKLEKQVKTIEQKIDKINLQISKLDEQLALPDLYQDAAQQGKVEQILEKKQQLSTELDALQDKWFELMQQL